MATLYLIYHNYVFNGIHLILFTGDFLICLLIFIYHYLHVVKKTQKTEEKVSFFKKIQKISYTFIRIPVMSYLLYDMTNRLDLINPPIGIRRCLSCLFNGISLVL